MSPLGVAAHGGTPLWDPLGCQGHVERHGPLHPSQRQDLVAHHHAGPGKLENQVGHQRPGKTQPGKWRKYVKIIQLGSIFGG